MSLTVIGVSDDGRLPWVSVFGQLRRRTCDLTCNKVPGKKRARQRFLVWLPDRISHFLSEVQTKKLSASQTTFAYFLSGFGQESPILVWTENNLDGKLQFLSRGLTDKKCGFSARRPAEM
ncbi:unnamed protein product [Bursaphelenchus xylophilus]|uniref:(pine wood nematode) hypothetical protein n=1 Tax=Bursaphelenchus xylophilus TaxID=6326 RepID=A0A1I7SGG2_BURXY|nr:unnamed protein product [Bursaphelenchus xylophilus]CAG9125960.1 unnamed protein product [Bursaphelenchus xylophilus]